MNKITPNLIIHEELDSTNKYSMNKLRQNDMIEGTVVMANYQKSGRGQRGNQWESEKGQNLLFSLVLKPDFLEIKNQFQLNKIVALGLRNYIISEFNEEECSVKWPNDVLIGEKKIAGILIENMVSGAKIDWTIVGVGLNVNQTKFSKGLNATSLLNEYKVKLIPSDIVKKVVNSILNEYKNLQIQSDRLNSNYLSALYRNGVSSLFEIKGITKRGRICGVDEYGRLKIYFENGINESFDLKEVKFI